MQVGQFPASAANSLIQGYCDDFVSLAAVLAQTLEQIKPGSSTEYVESLLGTPTTRTPTTSGEQSVVWRYETWGKNTYVLFENGRVSKTWQD